MGEVQAPAPAIGATQQVEITLQLPPQPAPVLPVVHWTARVAAVATPMVAVVAALIAEGIADRQKTMQEVAQALTPSPLHHLPRRHRFRIVAP